MAVILDYVVFQTYNYGQAFSIDNTCFRYLSWINSIIWQNFVSKIHIKMYMCNQNIEVQNINKIQGQS